MDVVCHRSSMEQLSGGILQKAKIFLILKKDQKELLVKQSVRFLLAIS